jgi:phosphoglycerate dehydrogenase-like enzyme
VNEDALFQMMNPALLVSQKVVSEFGPRLERLLAEAPRRLDILPFTPDLRPTPDELARIEAVYYSRDVWEGTDKNALSPAARALWEIIDRARNLKWLAVYAAGSDQQRFQDAMKRGIRLTTGAGAQAESVALAAVTGMLALGRCVPHWLAAQQRREWAPLRGASIPPDMPGQTAVIVGVGYIGKVVARVLHAVGMKTVGIRRSPGPVEHCDHVLPPGRLDGVLPTCDWLVLACPLTPETRGLMDRRRLALLRPGAGLVNIARGEVIDEPALAEALAGGKLRCAYLDVFAVEPLPADSPLWGLSNVLISPHNAGASTGTYARGVEIFLRNVSNYLGGAPLENEAAPD